MLDEYSKLIDKKRINHIKIKSLTNSYITR